MRKLLFLICVTVFCECINGQTFRGSIGGTQEDLAQGIARDAAGNVYITGYFTLTADFDMGSGVANLTANGAGKDIFIAKYNSSGALLWAKSIGDASDDGGYGIALDATGGVYVSGTFGGAVDFDPGAGVSTLEANATINVFVCKLDGNGNFLWAKSFADASAQTSGGIALDLAGNVYTTGIFAGTADFDPGPGVFNISPTNGDNNLFVVKLDPSGNLLWAKAMGGNQGSNMAFGIAVDGSGNVVTTGYYSGLMDFDPGPGVVVLNTQNSGQGCYVSKLDAAGNYVWAKSFDGIGGDVGQSVALDGSGNVYVTGDYQMNVDFDPGPGVMNLTSFGGTQDIFIVKLNSSGDLVWAKSIGNISADVGFGITVDSSEDVYTTGEFGATVDFDPGPDEFNLTGNSFADVFVLKLDASGNFVWAQGMGGSQNDWGIGIVADNAGNVATTGVFEGTVDFDPGPGVTDLTSAGGLDIFLTVPYAGAILPVRLVDFRVANGPWGNELHWEIAPAANAKEFAVERSNDNRSFVQVGNVAAASQASLKYQYLDKASLHGTAYYRLKTVDLEGNFAYSRVLKVEAGKDGGIKVTPGPAAGLFAIHLPGSMPVPVKAQIVDLSGRTMKAFTIRQNDHREDMSQYPGGVYFLQLEDGTAVKFIKH